MDAAVADGVRWRGTGVLEIFDADQLRFAIRRGARRFVSGDGSLADRVRAFRHGQLSRSDLLRGVVPSLWVPRAELARLGLRPVEARDAGENVLTVAGAQRMLELFANQNARQAMDATHTRIGFGDGSTAATDADTDLSAIAGATHRYFQLVDGAGTITAATGNKKIAFTVTVATGNGNLAAGTSEWCIDGGLTSGGSTVTAPMINRAVQALGTKSNLQSWAFTASLSLA